MSRKQISDCHAEIENYFSEFGNPRFPSIPSSTRTKPITIQAKNTDKGEYKGKLKFYVTVNPDGSGYVTLSSYKHGVLGVFHSYDYNDNSDYQVDQDLKRRERIERERIKREQADAVKQAAKERSHREHLERFPRLNSISPNSAISYFTSDKQIPLDWLNFVELRYADDGILDRCDIRFDKEFLVYQTQFVDGSPCSLSRIYDKQDKTAGNNKFAFAGGKRGVGAFLPIGNFKEANTILICESVADGIILYQAITYEGIGAATVAVTEDAGNIAKVLAALTDVYSDKDFIVIADNDDRTDKPNLDNTGITKAVNAANATGCKVKVGWPQEKGDVSDIWLKNNSLDDIRELVDSATIPSNGIDWQLEKIAKFVGSDHIDDCIKSVCFSIASKHPMTPVGPTIEKLLESVKAAYERYRYFFKGRCVAGIGVADCEWTEHAVKSNIQAIVTRLKEQSLQRYNLKELQRIGIKREQLTCELKDGKWRISETTKRQVISKLEGVHVIHSHKNSGKTHTLLTPFVEIGLKTNSFPVVINNKQALSYDLAKDLGIPCYLDVKAKKIAIEDCKGLVICLPSITNPEFDYILSKCKLIAIDEVNSVLSDIHGDLVPRTDKENVWNKLNSMINGADKALVASADIDQNTLLDLHSMRKDLTLWYLDKIYPSEAGKTVNLFTHKSDLRAQFLNHAKQGKKLLYVIDNKVDTEIIGDLVREHVKTGNPGLVIDGERTNVAVINRSTIKRADYLHFLKNIDTQIGMVDAVITSPSLAEGFNIRTKVDAVYGEYNQETTTQGHEQHQARARDTDTVNMFLPPANKGNRHDAANQAEIDEYLRSLVDISQVDINEALKNGEVTPPKIILTDFDKAHIRNLRGQIGARNPNDIPLRLEAQRAEIKLPTELTETQLEESGAVDAEVKEIKKTAKEQKLANQNKSVSDVFGEVKRFFADPLEPTDEEMLLADDYIASQYKRMTAQQKNSIEGYGYRLMTMYGYKVFFRDSELAMQLDGRGIFEKIRTLKSLLAPNQKLHAHHAYECEVLPVSQHWQVMTEARWARLLLTTLGLWTEQDGLILPDNISEIEYSGKSEHVINLVNKCRGDKEFAIAYKGIKTITPRLKVGKGGVKFVSNWLRQYGFKQVQNGNNNGKDRLRAYSLDVDVYTFVFDVINRVNVNTKLKAYL